MKSKIQKKEGKLYFPKKINLLGESYKIKLADCKCKKCDNEHAGAISYGEGVIKLHKNLNKDGVEYVLFHELAHFFADYYSLENSEMFANAFAKYIKNIIKQLGYVRRSYKIK